jgi:hypothetical protein
VRTITGTMANINAFIAASGISFTTATTATADVALTVDINDNGATGAGGAQAASTSVTLSVSAVNDPPVNTVPAAQVLNQNSSLIFNTSNGNLIGISDVDADGGSMQVTLTCTNGTMTLSGTTGLSFTVGSGSGDSTMTFTGTMTDVNSALNSLTYTPAPGYSGVASIQIMTSDQGNTGSGGAKTATDSIPLTVISSNVPPTDITLSASSISRSAVINAVVGTLGSTDADSASFTYSLVGGTGSVDNGSFNISGAILRVNNASLLSVGIYSIRIRVVDDHGGMFEKIFSVSVTSDWVIAGTGDFNGDRKPDLIWSNKVTGQRILWLMNGITGGFVPTSAVDLGNVDINWVVVGTADFNDDGQTDIIWQNTATGERFIWLMSATSHIGGATLGIVDLAWSIAAVGDFDRDGQADILWQNTITGERFIWFMSGSSHVGGVHLGAVDSSWAIVAAGDFDDDGQVDILWQNTTTGARFVWFMDGSSHVGGDTLGTVDPDWSIVAVADFNGDGYPDILWQNTVTGLRYLWSMIGTAHQSDVDLGRSEPN